LIVIARSACDEATHRNASSGFDETEIQAWINDKAVGGDFACRAAFSVSQSRPPRNHVRFIFP